MIRGKKVIVLLNKSDLESVVDKEEIEGQIKAPVLSVSAKKGFGLTELENTIKKLFFNGDLSFNDEVYITNERHKRSLQDTRKSLCFVEDSIRMNMPEDFFTIDLMNAYESLGEITGESVGEDLVDEIFSKFCTGK